MHQNFVVTDKEGNRVPFTSINNSVPVPVRRDPNRPCTIMVNTEYCADFIDAVEAKGWFHRLIPTD